MKNRFGFFPRPTFQLTDSPRIWFHAASVGEVQVAKAIIDQTSILIPGAQFILSTVTEQGHLSAIRQLNNKAYCIYAPLDLSWIVKRFLKILKPTAYICLETELWPNMLKAAYTNQIKVLLLNGRLSEKSFINYQKASTFVKEILTYFSSISAITRHDRDRFVGLGADKNKLVVNGNAKYDFFQNVSSLLNKTVNYTNNNLDDQKATREQVVNYYQSKLNIDQSQIVLVAGSTHGGEEEQLVNVFEKLKETVPSLILIIAPRHIQRIAKIERLFNDRQLDYQLLSKLLADKRNKNTILVDTIGELTSLYSIASFVFCGGSLVKKGGHNLMEPAFWGKPPFYGPFMDDFTDAKSMLESVGGGFPINSEQELLEQVNYYYNNKSEYKQASVNAEKVATKHKGSARRQAEMIKQIIFN